MLSRDEVYRIEKYDREQEIEENEKKYGSRLQDKIIKLEKTLAYYLGEDINTKHPLEREYVKLASMIPSKRNKQQNTRLAELGNLLSKAVDASNRAFKEELDKHCKEELDKHINGFVV